MFIDNTVKENISESLFACSRNIIPPQWIYYQHKCHSWIRIILILPLIYNTNFRWEGSIIILKTTPSAYLYFLSVTLITILKIASSSLASNSNILLKPQIARNFTYFSLSMLSQIGFRDDKLEKNWFSTFLYAIWIHPS